MASPLSGIEDGLPSSKFGNQVAHTNIHMHKRASVHARAHTHTHTRTVELASSFLFAVKNLKYVTVFICIHSQSMHSIDHGTQCHLLN